MTSSLSLASDYKYCEQIIKRHSRSFYYAFSKLPAEKAKAVYAIYAFCRTADDSVDENGTREAQLDALRKLEEDLILFEVRKERDEPMWRALRDVFNRFDMDIKPFYDQIKGQYMDIDFSMPETIEDIERYSYYVAGTVGLMLLPIIASKNCSALQKDAVYLGIAMQLTNILRDIGEDLTFKNRVYIPREIMVQEKYSVTELKQSVINEAFMSVWERMARHAEKLYAKFHRTVHLYDADS